MSNFWIFSLVLLLGHVCGLCAAGQIIDITDKQGRELHVEVIARKAGNVTFYRLPGRREFTVPISSLSVESQKQVQSLIFPEDLEDTKLTKQLKRELQTYVPEKGLRSYRGDGLNQSRFILVYYNGYVSSRNSDYRDGLLYRETLEELEAWAKANRHFAVFPIYFANYETELLFVSDCREFAGETAVLSYEAAKKSHTEMWDAVHRQEEKWGKKLKKIELENGYRYEYTEKQKAQLLEIRRAECHPLHRPFVENSVRYEFALLDRAGEWVAWEGVPIRGDFKTVSEIIEEHYHELN